MSIYLTKIKYSFLVIILLTFILNTDAENRGSNSAHLCYEKHSQIKQIQTNYSPNLSSGDSILYVVTYVRRGLNVVIFSNQWGRDTIFSNLPLNARVIDVNITIDTINHTWDDVVEVHLRKGAVNERIISNVGGSGDNFLHTILDDSASQPLSSGSPPFSGRWKPSPPALLSHFNLMTVNGAWIIEASSIAGGDTGQLKAWTLTIVYDLISGQQNNNETIPDEFILYQNYPNPFNPSTQITYGLPKKELVKVSIFDIKGEEVLIFDEGSKPAGTYSLFVNANNLPSGVYFYKITAGDFTDTKKMVLIK